MSGKKKEEKEKEKERRDCGHACFVKLCFLLAFLFLWGAD